MEINDKVFFPSEWVKYPGKKEYVTFGKVLTGYIVKRTKTSATVKVTNEAKFVNRKNLKRVPISIIKATKEEVMGELK